ncbi:phage terminase large subunit, partial [bacterium]|nr:phage terminase large subunit [bacterium]
LIGLTPILTNIGEINIEALVEMPIRPKVLAHNHETGVNEWQNIIAASVSYNDRILEIETVRGRKIRTTREHRFFVNKQGYKEAYSLQPGDRIVTTQIPGKQDMSILRETEKRQGPIMPGVLSQITACPDNPEMHSMRHRIRNSYIRLSKSISKRPRGFLLFNRMFKKTSCGKKCKTMQAMWKTNARRSKPQILFTCMQRSSKSSPGCSKTKKDMSRMWHTIYSNLSPNTILFKRLRKYSTFKTYDWTRKLSLQNWNKLCQMVHRDEALNYGARQIQMRDMWEKRTHIPNNTKRAESTSDQSSHSSFERRSQEQHPGESGNSLQNLPYDIPQIEYDQVAVVREIHCESIPVYDIQVEKRNNFFAGEILVHNCFIIDDPIKNQDEANSKLQRDRVDEWYKSVVYTRLDTDISSIILMMTRWHDDDLAGRRIKEMNKGGEEWTVVSIPAIAEKDDLLGRTIGAPLWPQRFPLPYLNKIKGTIGIDWWTALYQQNPIQQTGKLFKRQYFRYFTKENDIYKLWAQDGSSKSVKVGDCWIFQTCDPAASTRESADYFALATWAVTPENDLLLLDMFRERLEGPDQPALFKQLNDLWHPQFQAVETAGLGKTLFQMLVREGLPVQDLQSSGQDLDKLTRARPAAARMKAGAVYFSKGAHWLPDYEDELIAFDKGAHDDQVDVTSYGARCLVETFDEDEADPFIIGI